MFTMPVVSGLSDRARDRRHVMAGLISLTLGFSMLFGFAHGDLAVMAVGSILLVLSYCVGPLADAFAMIMDRHGLGEYGKMRLWGSASFILGNIVGGYAMEHSGSTAVYLLVLFGFVIAMCPPSPFPPRRRSPHSLPLQRSRCCVSQPSWLYCWGTRSIRRGMPHSTVLARSCGGPTAFRTLPSASSGPSASSPRSFCSHRPGGCSGPYRR